MTPCPAAMTIQESFQSEGTSLSDLDAAFIEIVLFYNEENQKLLYHCPVNVVEDVILIARKREEARKDKDWAVADAARKLLTDSGCRIEDEPGRTIVITRDRRIEVKHDTQSRRRSTEN